MSSITFDRFDLGIDLRKGASVSDANRLREMKNAHVTTGLATRKRPGLIKVATLEEGTKGLFAAFGKLQTFYSQGGPIVHANALFNANQLTNIASDITDIEAADVFNAYIYVSAKYANGSTHHHYLDGTATNKIADANCPNSASFIKTASKIFAINGETVRYCATNAPRDWTTANDAGFLPTGLNFVGARDANALGLYGEKLVVLAVDGAQVWVVDPDPTAMKKDKNVENVGTSFPKSVVGVSGDLYFLSDYGFRSITTLQLTSNLADVDIGSPIDPIVTAEIKLNTYTPRAFYYYGTGQYLCALGNQLFVYSVSRTSKIAAWSRYFLPTGVDAFAQLGKQLYIRAGNDVYRLTDEVYADDGAAYEVLIELPYMNLKKPGQTKHIIGADVVIQGRCEFSIGYNVNKPDDFTPPVRIRGNTAANGMIPVECSGTEFSLRFRNFDTEAFQLDSVTLYYDVLGAV